MVYSTLKSHLEMALVLPVNDEIPVRGRLMVVSERDVFPMLRRLKL
jgi:hypothetical protein